MALVIERTLDLDAAPGRVWKALTDPRHLEQWFPDEADFELRPGARGVLTWHEHVSGDFEIVEVVPETRFVWRWGGNDDRSLEEYSTLVEWTLTPNGTGGTALHLRESGFDSDQHLQENSGGWTHELGELVTYLEAGTSAAS